MNPSLARVMLTQYPAGGFMPMSRVTEVVGHIRPQTPERAEESG